MLAKALTIAGSDSGGGAGIQADLKTFAALGVYGMSAITAITAQNTCGVSAVQGIDPEVVAAQIRAVVTDIGVGAAKTGMLFSAEIIQAVATTVRALDLQLLVVDPVMVATSGDRLLQREAEESVRQDILPLATVVTPNTLEARRLGGVERLLERGCRYVLVTGTHDASAEVSNRLYDSGGLVREDRWKRLPGSYHGSGCTLASGIAAHLAQGREVPEATRAAQEFTWLALAAGFRTGAGQALPNRFFNR